MSNLDAAMFRAYDIRGVADIHGNANNTLNRETIFVIGKAFGSFARDAGLKEIAIARDGRLSGPILADALSKGILASGCDVVDLGMVPTPVLYYATHILPDHSGIMLTGSHNPSNYNGVKMVLQGHMFAGDRIRELYARIHKGDFCEGAGKLRKWDLLQDYIDQITRTIHLKRPLTIVIDAGNGVTGMMAPQFFQQLGCNVHALYCDVDGHFPNHHPDPGEPQNMRDLISAVHQYQADVGLAFDGDGDRLGVISSQGEMIYPDRLLMLFAQSLLAERPNEKIIFDVKCTDQLTAHIRHHQGEPIMWKTGHSLIKAKIAETDALLAGEMSGHFFFKDRWFGFDDALYAGARLLEILAQQNKTSDEIFAAFPTSINTPELKINVREEEKFSLMQALIECADFKEAKEIMTIDGLRVSFEHGWGLVRPSNTTPCLILRFEAINEAIMEKIQTLFRNWLLSVKPDLVLPF